MAPGLPRRPAEIYSDDKNGEVTGLDLNFLARGYCPFTNISMLDSNSCSWSALDERRNYKRLKQAARSDEPHGSNGGTAANSFTSLPRLQFRDHVWAYTRRYLAMEAMEQAAVVMMEGKENEINQEVGGDGMKLVQQLVSCAEAVACRDKVHGSALLSELRANALVFGTSFQRVASCFVQGLSDRLANVQPLGAAGVVGPTVKSLVVSSEKDEALRLVYEICPQIQFGHFVANASILEALVGESLLHIVDLGMTLGLPDGHQWQKLMHSLANHARKPTCRLRITGVGSSSERLRAIGDQLGIHARSLSLDFEFLVVESNLENLNPKDINVGQGEVLVINSILQLHCVVKESRGALNSVLQRLNELSPKLLILVEQDSSHNGPFFLGRFMEALHYYSAIFDSLDAMLPKYDTRRAKMEQFFFAEEIKNIVSCEGPARVERHERVDQWRRRMSRAGFQPSPIKMTMQAKQWLARVKAYDGHTIIEEKGCLVLRWKYKPIIAASCWKCS